MMPEWVTDQTDNFHQEDSCSFCRLTEALTLAWESLEKIEKSGTVHWKDSDAVHIEYSARLAIEALASIRKLGEGR